MALVFCRFSCPLCHTSITTDYDVVLCASRSPKMHASDLRNRQHTTSHGLYIPRHERAGGGLITQNHGRAEIRLLGR